MIHQIDNKVPTQIAYNRSGNLMPSKWGFDIDMEDLSLDVREMFKLDLDPRYESDMPGRDAMPDVRRWYTDYMRCVYQHLAATLTKLNPRWRTSKVEFLFSVPTTWKDRTQVAQVEDLLRQAGFGTEGQFHHVEISLTEAEAAAIFASKQQYQVTENSAPYLPRMRG
jgi:hypothetical protein